MVRDKENVNEENTKLRLLLEEKLRESDDLRSKLEEIRTIDMKLRESEGKITLLNGELERASGNLRNKAEEAENWRRKCEALEKTRYEREGLLEENGRLQDRLRVALGELEDQRRKVQELGKNILIVQYLLD